MTAIAQADGDHGSAAWLDWLRSVVAMVSFSTYTFEVLEGQNGVVLRAFYAEPDSRTAKDAIQYTRRWALTPAMTESEIVQTAFKCCLTSMEHRTREFFKYQGERVYSPHYDVRDLVALCRSGRADAGGRS